MFPVETIVATELGSVTIDGAANQYRTVWFRPNHMAGTGHRFFGYSEAMAAVGDTPSSATETYHTGLVNYGVRIVGAGLRIKSNIPDTRVTVSTSNSSMACAYTYEDITSGSREGSYELLYGEQTLIPTFPIAYNGLSFEIAADSASSVAGTWTNISVALNLPSGSQVTIDYVAHFEYFHDVDTEGNSTDRPSFEIAKYLASALNFLRGRWISHFNKLSEFSTGPLSVASRGVAAFVAPDDQGITGKKREVEKAVAGMVRDGVRKAISAGQPF
jgi:hypothetical protein